MRKHMISPGLAGVAFKFTVKMQATRILHEKTQRFLRGRREGHVRSRKFTVEMKPRRMSHEKTERFLRGRREGHVHFT